MISYLRLLGGAQLAAAIAALAGCASPYIDLPADPTIGCINDLVADDRYRVLLGKLQMSMVAPDEALMAYDDRPNAAERAALASYIGERDACFAQGEPARAQSAPAAVRSMITASQSEYSALAARLYNGELTYGEFERGRAEINIKYSALSRAALEQGTLETETEPPPRTTCHVVLARMECTTQ